MVDHGVSTDDGYTLLEKTNLHTPAKFRRQFSTNEGIKEFLKQRAEESKESIKSSPVSNCKLKTTEKWDLQRLHEKLSKTVTELLSRSPSDYENTISAKEVRYLEEGYKYVTEKFLLFLTKYLKSTKDLRQEVIRTLKKFQLISRVAAKITVGTCITNVFLVIAAVTQKMGKNVLQTKASLISNIVVGLSFTASLLTISYMRQTTTNVARNIRRENHVLLDLLTSHRKGDWVDARVERLFPYGIDLNFIDKKALETSNYFDNRYVWKKYLSSSIILSNIYKNALLLDDNTFLTTVKLFVESPAAEVWWSRIKIRKLLEAVNEKANNISIKEFLSAHESYVSKTSLYLYPLVLPWLVSSWNSEQMKFFCSLIAGFLAVTDLGNDSEEELKEFKVMYASFEKDFQEIETICRILDSNDD